MYHKNVKKESKYYALQNFLSRENERSKQAKRRQSEKNVVIEMMKQKYPICKLWYYVYLFFFLRPLRHRETTLPKKTQYEKNRKNSRKYILFLLLNFFLMFWLMSVCNTRLKAKFVYPVSHPNWTEIEIQMMLMRSNICFAK